MNTLTLTLVMVSDTSTPHVCLHVLLYGRTNAAALQYLIFDISQTLTPPEHWNPTFQKCLTNMLVNMSTVLQKHANHLLTNVPTPNCMLFKNTPVNLRKCMTTISYKTNVGTNANKPCQISANTSSTQPLVSPKFPCVPQDGGWV